MQENIRKIVEAGCPILAGSLFLRLGWDTTRASPALVLAFALPTPTRPPQNVAKSVAKARKNTQVTTSQLQPHQQHTMDFCAKTPPPPPFRRKMAVWRTKKTYKTARSLIARYWFKTLAVICPGKVSSVIAP